MSIDLLLNWILDKPSNDKDLGT